MNDITLKFNPTTNSFALAGADYQTLLSTLIISANPDGTPLKVILQGNVFDPQADVQADQAQLIADQDKLAQDQIQAQSINSNPSQTLG